MFIFYFFLSFFFFFKQKTAYDMRISDWSSDVCSSDLDLDPGHIRRLALIRRHTQRRVALEMFDRAEILARGELNVARCHIVLAVDPSRPRARIAAGEMHPRSDRSGDRVQHIAALTRASAAREPVCDCR